MTGMRSVTGMVGRREAGAAVVDFTLVGVLVTLVFVSVVQLAVIEHVHNTLVDCAGDGARVGALADRSPSDGAARARELVVADLSSRYAGDIQARRGRFAGLEVVVVTIRAPLPVLGLLGVGRMLTVEGHAVAEAP